MESGRGSKFGEIVWGGSSKVVAGSSKVVGVKGVIDIGRGHRNW